MVDEFNVPQLLNRFETTQLERLRHGNLSAGWKPRERENHEEVPGTTVRIHAVRVLPGIGSLRRQRIQLGCVRKRIGLGSFCFNRSERLVRYR